MSSFQRIVITWNLEISLSIPFFNRTHISAQTYHTHTHSQTQPRVESVASTSFIRHFSIDFCLCFLYFFFFFPFFTSFRMANDGFTEPAHIQYENIWFYCGFFILSTNDALSTHLAISIQAIRRKNCARARWCNTLNTLTCSSCWFDTRKSLLDTYIDSYVMNRKYN